MIGTEKIRAEHRDRTAFVYARQSTTAQALHNRTSTERQFGLAKLAIELGWSKSSISVVDDLGRSGKLSEGREGFQRLAAEMSMGRVGAVLSLDASRLARSSADWHRLLEIAVLTRTLLIDEATVYDPRDPNDRLVLGMKGTMADFELVWLRQRMEGGRWHLARRGEYRAAAPAGYLYEDDEAKHLSFDPNEEVRRAIQLVFDRFRNAGSVKDVVAHFNDNELRLPSRSGNQLIWAQPNRTRVRNILRNPTYAGVYAFGRKRTEMVLDDGVRRRRARPLSRSEWVVTIHDAHPAYTTWEEYLSNEKKLLENAARRTGDTNRGAAREGRALLQGMLICGHCGARPAVVYRGHNGRSAAYQCRKREQDVNGALCFTVQLGNLDLPITQLILAMLTKEHLLDATRVVQIVDEQNIALARQWELRLERMRYDASRAERQYDACDPDNRTVARSLEKRWNDRLAELEDVEREYENFKRGQRFELAEIDRRRIMALASDLPKLWRAKATENRDRKLLLRLLIKDISVRSIDVPRSMLHAKILWHTHAVTELEIDRIGKPLKREAVPCRVISTTASALAEGARED